MNRWALGVLLAVFSLALGRAHADDPAVSLYDLDIELTDQSGRSQPLALYRDQVVLVTMFYGSCPMACPLLIDSVRAIETALPSAQRQRVKVLMVSIDPERDTPQALAELAKQRRIDLTRWTLARTGEDDVRLLAAALDIQYRKLPDGQYNHTSVISLLSPQGQLLRQTSVLGRADAEFVSAVQASLR